MSFSNVFTSSFAHESDQLSLSQFRFLPDAALRDIYSNLQALQRYYQPQFWISSAAWRLSTFHLQRKLLDNSALVKLDWIVFSPTAESIFCFVCRLFDDYGFKDTGVLSAVRFNVWRNNSRSKVKNIRRITWDTIW